MSRLKKSELTLEKENQVASKGTTGTGLVLVCTVSAELLHLVVQKILHIYHLTFNTFFWWHAEKWEHVLETPQTSHSKALWIPGGSRPGTFVFWVDGAKHSTAAMSARLSPYDLYV